MCPNFADGHKLRKVRKMASSLGLKPPMQPIISPRYVVETDRRIVLDTTVHKCLRRNGILNLCFIENRRHKMKRNRWNLEQKGDEK